MTARKYADYDKTLPQYNRNLGDMISALKAALITGYNGTPSVDWELVYESQSNPSDTSKRIAVRSKSANSEQKVFEITDISSTEGSIKCWGNWSGLAGVNLLMQAKINKNNDWGTMEIVADDKFVHLIVNACYHCFGDADVFDTTQQKTIISNMQNLSAIDYAHAIASTVNQGRMRLINTQNLELICRSFCKDQLGYGARLDYKEFDYEVYAGGDTAVKNSNILTPVRNTELLQIFTGPQNTTCYAFFGFLPMSVYTDNPATMFGKKVTIGKEKRLTHVLTYAGGLLSFAVDV